MSATSDIPAIIPLRDDVEMFPGTRGSDGHPTFVLHDRWRNVFVNIGWLEFELLKRWNLKDIFAIANSVCDETPLYAEPEDVANLQKYLSNQQLLSSVDNGEHTKNVIEKLRRAEEKELKSKGGIASLRPKLMFRIPLFKPDKFLDAMLWLVKPLMTKKALMVYAVMLFVGLTQVLQQWHEFVSQLYGIISLTGAFSLLIALAISKSFHELGHAFACKVYGLKVPTMGVMLMMIFPFLYTDTTESWKLESRAKRIWIGSAGVLAELQLAVIATLLWAVLPDGPVKQACFYLCTAAWIATLAINLSPFLRWDGYWVLSDLVGIQNLRERSNTMAKWFFSKVIVGHEEPRPGILPDKKVAFAIWFSCMSWLYRVGIMMVMGALIFERVFKVLGIFLLSMLMFAMAIGPIYSAVSDWIKEKEKMNWNRYSIGSSIFFTSLFLFLVIPWKSNIDSPAIMAPHSHIEVYTGVGGQIEEIVAQGESLEQGDTLFRLRNPDLRFERELKEETINYYTLDLQRVGSQTLLENRARSRDQLQRASSAYVKVAHQEARLEGQAPYDGQVVWVSENAKSGMWVSEGMPILSFADRNTTEVYAYIDEYELQRLNVDEEVLFFPENPYFEPVEGVIKELSSTNANVLDYEALAAVNGGPIMTTNNEETGRLMPTDAVYLARIELIQKDKEFPIMIRGTAVFKGQRKSYASRFWEGLVGAVIRESGF